MDRGTPFVHMQAGALSAFVNCVALQPLDLVKTRLQQVQHSSPNAHLRPILRQVMQSPQGIWGFWRGTVATVIRNVPGVALYFSSLQILRTSAQKTLKVEKLSPQVNLVCGATGRAAVGVVLMPFTVVKSRLESSLYKYVSLSLCA